MLSPPPHCYHHSASVGASSAWSSLRRASMSLGGELQKQYVNQMGKMSTSENRSGVDSVPVGQDTTTSTASIASAAAGSGGAYNPSGGGRGREQHLLDPLAFPFAQESKGPDSTAQCLWADVREVVPCVCGRSRRAVPLEPLQSRLEQADRRHKQHITSNNNNNNHSCNESGTPSPIAHTVHVPPLEHPHVSGGSDVDGSDGSAGKPYFFGIDCRTDAERHATGTFLSRADVTRMRLTQLFSSDQGGVCGNALRKTLLSQCVLLSALTHALSPTPINHTSLTHII